MRITSVIELPDGSALAPGATVHLEPDTPLTDDDGRVIGQVIAARATDRGIEVTVDLDEATARLCVDALRLGTVFRLT